MLGVSGARDLRDGSNSLARFLVILVGFPKRQRCQLRIEQWLPLGRVTYS